MSSQAKDETARKDWMGLLARAKPAALVALLSLAACGDAGAPESMGEDGAAAAPSDAATSAAPDTPVSNSPSPGASASPESMPAPDSTSADDECGAAKVSAYVAQEATPAVRARLAATAVLASLGLAACSLAPTYQRPELPVPAALPTRYRA